jgi:integrative and conjugative element protein (TIGR02256 family)
VTIVPEADRRIRELARESADGRETGGILIGRGPNAANVITVERAGDPGPAAKRCPDYFLRDLAHAKRLASAAWEEDQGVWIGEWHTHPTGPTMPSARDLTTYTALLTDSELAFSNFVSVIVVPAPCWDAARLLVWVLGAAAGPPDSEYGRP